MRLVAEVDARIRAVSLGRPLEMDGPVPVIEALAEDIEIHRVTWPAHRALEEIIEEMPDIVLVDFGSEVEEAMSLIVSIRPRFPMMKIVVLGPAGATDYARAALRAGARAYLSKGTRPEDFAAALRAIQGDHAVIDLESARALFTVPAPRTPLRRIELQVLRLLADGFSYAEIGEQLEISRSTLKRYLNHIATKLEARNRVQAVALAARQGLI